MLHMLDKILIQNGLVTSFFLVGLIMWVSNALSKYLTFGRVHGSAIAIMIGLALAFLGGLATGGEPGHLPRSVDAADRRGHRDDRGDRDHEEHREAAQGERRFDGDGAGIRLLPPLPS